MQSRGSRTDSDAVRDAYKIRDRISRIPATLGPMLSRGVRSTLHHGLDIGLRDVGRRERNLIRRLARA